MTPHILPLLPSDIIHISREWPSSRKETADLLRSIDLLLSFDPNSQMNLESTLCGTPVLVCEDETWKRWQVESFLWGTVGFAWSADEVEKARNEVLLAHARFSQSLDMIANDLDKFIRITQGMFA